MVVMSRCPEQLQPWPVPSHPSCPCAAVRADPRTGWARWSIEWYTEMAARQCALAVHVLPEEHLTNRDALAACLTQELRDLGQRRAEAIANHWQHEWEALMA